MTASSRNSGFIDPGDTAHASECQRDAIRTSFRNNLVPGEPRRSLRWPGGIHTDVEKLQRFETVFDVLKPATFLIEDDVDRRVDEYLDIMEDARISSGRP